MLIWKLVHLCEDTRSSVVTQSISVGLNVYNEAINILVRASDRRHP